MDLWNLSPLVFHSSLLLPSSCLPSAVRRNQYGLVVFPRMMSIQSVKREKCGVLYFPALLQSFCITSVSEERGTGSLWLECTPIHSPDLNLSFNRPCTHGNVRFIFCTNFRLLYSGSSSLLSIEYRFNTARFLDCDPCVLNPLFLDIRANFVQGNFSCYIISRSWSYFYPGIHPFSRNSQNYEHIRTLGLNFLLRS